MKSAWKFIKDLFSQPNQHESMSEPSIQKLVNANALNKRRNARVKYPHFGAIGPFPKIFYMNTELNVGNISVGGILIFDDTERLGSTVGEIITLEFSWNDTSIKTRGRLVGATLQRRHIQFIDFNPQLFLRISQLVKPGYLGSRFHRVLDMSGQLHADEMWLGPNNESLVFLEDRATLTLGQERIVFQRGRPATFLKNDEPLKISLINECLVMISNFPELTDRAKTLLETIETELKTTQPARTGTDG